MTTNQETSLRERCEALIAKWLDAADYLPSRSAHFLQACADQLEAALAAHSEPQAGEWVQQLAECFRLAGGDTECVSTAEGQARQAVAVVRDLRACYDEALAAAPSPASRARPEPPGGESDPFKRIPGLHEISDAADYFARNPADEYAKRRLRERLDAFAAMRGLADSPSPAPRARPEAQGESCPHCGAPCRKEVLMRGGDNGWGDDASRTVYRYVPPADRAPGEVVTDHMVEDAARVVAQIAGEDYDEIGEFAQTILKETQRAALTAALTHKEPAR